MDLKDLNNILHIELVGKIEEEITTLIKPTIKQMAIDLASNIHTMMIFERDWHEGRLKIDISENEKVKELENDIIRLNSKLAQNNIR